MAGRTMTARVRNEEVFQSIGAATPVFDAFAPGLLDPV
jgi:hypothetical protein